MSRSGKSTLPTHASPALWPSAEYDRQLERLRGAQGQTVYIVEARIDGRHISARNSGTAHELLAIVDFPRPDPALHLYPHLLLLSDGRGVNLGRILRVSTRQPYMPKAADILFENIALTQRILPRERSLSAQRIRRTAQRQLSELTVTLRPVLPGGSDMEDD